MPTRAARRDRRAGGGSRARAATSCPDRVMVLIATMKSQAVLREGQRPAGPRAVRRSTGARARCASWRCCADVVRSCLFEPAAVTGRTGRRSQIGGMHTAEGLFVPQKRATLTVKVSHESRVMRRCVASEAALCESEQWTLASPERVHSPSRRCVLPEYPTFMKSFHGKDCSFHQGGQYTNREHATDLRSTTARSCESAEMHAVRPRSRPFSLSQSAASNATHTASSRDSREKPSL